MLSERLGIHYYDKELLKLASEDSGINEDLFRNADEHVKTTQLFKIAHSVYKGELIPPESDDFTSMENLFNYQAKIIREVAKEESCVIIGRCADYVLRDCDYVKSLFFYAPREDCIARVKQQNGGSEKEIAKKIDRIDKYRAEYYKYYTGKTWNDARNYDFCLDTTSLSYDKLVQVVKAYLEISEQ